MKRKVCVVTGSRAEYGLLKPLLEEISNDPALKLQLIVTGMHLCKEFGLTYHEIEQDGFCIDAKVDIALTSDSIIGIASSMGRALRGCIKAYERLKPHLVVILGDRFEIFSIAAAGLLSRIPIAHINGGELTEGVIDDAFRHSITKMSQLHFASTETYRRRIIQLGEDPERVFNVGALNIDAIRKTELLSKEALEDELSFTFKEHNLLITYHPVTLESNASGRHFQYLLAALGKLKNTQLIFTKSNADPGGRAINQMIDEYAGSHKDNAIGFTSLGHKRYVSLMQFVDAVVGNSSSGITEAPYFKIGTINIGDRQKGRLRTSSIIDCLPLRESIHDALGTLYSHEFRKKLQTINNPYGNGNAALHIRDILKKYNLQDILKKEFYDMKFDEVMSYE